MTGIVFATQPAAVALQGAFDTALGYPKAGVNVGGGRHVAPAVSQTTHSAAVFTDGVSFALQTSTEIDAAVSVPLNGGVRQPLVGNWT